MKQTFRHHLFHLGVLSAVLLVLPDQLDAAVSTADLELHYSYDTGTVSTTTVTDQWTVDGDEDNVARGSLSTFIGGKFGDAIDVSTVNATPRVPTADPVTINAGWLPGTSDYTLTFWYRQDATVASGNRIWGAGARNAGGNKGGLQVYLQGPNQATEGGGAGFIHVTAEEPSGASQTMLAPAAAGTWDGTAWNHIAVVRTGPDLSVWVNGSVALSDTLTVSNIAVNDGVWWREAAFGPDVDTIGNAAYDDAAVFHRALSAAEIAEIYNSGTGTPLSDFTVADTDNDGLPDTWEQQIIDAAAAEVPAVILTLADIHGPDDAAVTSDYDMDGLVDADEFFKEADPVDPDSDDDGLDDGPEFHTHLTDLLDADSDDDLLTDGAEVNIHLTDPNLFDTDNDFYSDQIEIGSGSDPTLPGSVPTILMPVDQLAVDNNIPGLLVIDPDSLFEHVGQPLDDFIAGTLVYSFTMEYTTLANGTGAQGYAAVQVNDGTTVQFGVGDNWDSTNWSIFGGAEADLLDSGDAPVALATGAPETITVTVDYNVGADDTVTVNFRGKDNVLTRDMSMTELRVRSGDNGTQIVNVSNMSFDFTISPDIDVDGLPDTWEQQIISAAAAEVPPVVLTLADIHGPDDATITSDYDMDGLVDADEFIEGFDPIDPDSDDDGLDDGPEWNIHFTDPLDPDTDNDSLTDGAEVNEHGSDPTLTESDFDGIADGLEVASGSLPNDINSIPAILTPLDQTGVTGGGGGITIIDPASLAGYLGGPADDTLSGTFAYSFDLEFTQLANGTGEFGFAAVQLWLGEAERLGVGDRWPDTNWSGFHAPGTGNFVLLDSGSNPVALALNDKRTVSVSIEMVAGGDDTVTVTFEGSDQVFTGPLDFDQVRVRCGNAGQAADFSNMSFSFTPDSDIQLAISPHDSINDEVTLTVSNVPGGGAQTFHLRSSTDGQTFTPVAGTEFAAGTSFTYGPLLGAGDPVALFQVYNGPIVP